MRIAVSLSAAIAAVSLLAADAVAQPKGLRVPVTRIVVSFTSPPSVERLYSARNGTMTVTVTGAAQIKIATAGAAFGTLPVVNSPRFSVSLFVARAGQWSTPLYVAEGCANAAHAAASLPAGSTRAFSIDADWLGAATAGASPGWSFDPSTPFFSLPLDRDLEGVRCTF